jgi:hypothetical protein
MAKTRDQTAQDNTEALLERARSLARAGEFDEARQEYLAVLSRLPTHAGALNDLGALLHRTGFRSAARTVFEHLIAVHPRAVDGRVNFGNFLLADGDAEGAQRQYGAALAIAPDLAEAHQGMGKALVELGDRDLATDHLRRGYQGRAVTVAPYRGGGEPKRVLQLVSAYGGNIATGQFLDERRYQVASIVAEFHDPTRPLPAHDLIVNAIGDADLCEEALVAAEALVAISDRPLINQPAHVRQTGRVENAAKLASVPDVIAPRTMRLSRDGLARATLEQSGFSLPILLRAPGHHTGRHFVRVETEGDLDRAVTELPGSELLAIAPLDAVGPDGKARKYRVMIVDGQLYPLHLAISDHWKVHYFTAGMAEHPERIAEEAAFLSDMPGVLGSRAMAALGAIGRALGLDYAGIDFALGPDGQVLLFEANATMVIAMPDADDRWRARRQAAQDALNAVEAMLTKRLET